MTSLFAQRPEAALIYQRPYCTDRALLSRPPAFRVFLAVSYILNYATRRTSPLGRQPPVADHRWSVAANVSEVGPASSTVTLRGPDFNAD